MELIGTVVRLQVQRSRLKPGERGARRYDPAPLLAVEALDVGPRGVVGRTPGAAGELEAVLDVHHADHPDTRNVKLRNGLSLLPRAHYTLMRDRFGPHLVDGAAGESLLLDTTGPWTLDALSGPLALELGDGELLPLTGVMVAEPCIEFSRFCLGAAPDEPVGPDVQAAMVDLSGGVRGFYVQVVGEGSIVAGSRLLRLPA